VKRHPGVQRVGERLRRALANSEIVASNRGRRTQDALSIRSIPQIHGASATPSPLPRLASMVNSIRPPTIRWISRRP